MSKIYVLDTNVLLHDPKSLFVFQENEVVIPLVVLDELDKAKKGFDEVARNARSVIRSLDDMRQLGNLHSGVETEDGGLIRVDTDYSNFHSELDCTKPDNKIIGVALNLITETKKQVKIVTKDINLRVKCDALNVPCEDYNADLVADSTESLYSGITTAFVDSNIIDEMYSTGESNADQWGKFYPNQYVQLISLSNQRHTSLARYYGGKFFKLITIGSIWGISARNREQACALDALFNPSIKLVTLIGLPGGGKTLLAVAAGVSQVLDQKIYNKLIMTRPIQPMGKDLGYLPGGLDEKMQPWMSPLHDNLELLFSDKGSQYLDMHKENGIIQVEALTYIRGRSIPQSFIILDESQNLSKHEVKTAITRVGEDTKIVLTGDIKQIDNIHIGALDNGLSYVVEKFKDQNMAAHVTLKKGERSDLATIASEIL